MQAASVERSVCWAAIVGIFASSRDGEMLGHVDLLRASALNEQELWREMVRWSGGRIVEDEGVLLVSGPSSYLRVAIRTDPRVDADTVLARATEFFAAGFLVLVRPDEEDLERAALAAGFRAGGPSGPWRSAPRRLPASRPTTSRCAWWRTPPQSSTTAAWSRSRTTTPASASVRRCCSTTRRSSLRTSPRSWPTWVMSPSRAQ